jgi:hypothetical protein
MKSLFIKSNATFSSKKLKDKRIACLNAFELLIGSSLLWTGEDTFNECGQSDVLHAQSVHVMSRQGDLHSIVHVEPFRMMIELFRLQGDATHEAERFVEVVKLELFGDCIATGSVQLPLFVQQRTQLQVTLFDRQLGHFGFAREGGRGARLVTRTEHEGRGAWDQKRTTENSERLN